MKNLLILGLVSLLLFSVAAGLSVWLQQTKTQATDDKEKDKPEKKGLKDDKDKPAKEEKKDKGKEAKDKTEPKEDGPLTDAAEDQARRAELKRREARLEKQKAQQALVLEDMSALRQEVDRAAKQRDAEVKANAREELNATPDPQPKKPAVLPTGFADRPTSPPQPDPNEKKNLDRLAVMIEAMPPETAAKLIQEMADGGKMDTAVKVLAQMRERAAGKVLAEIQDRTLAAQLVNRMLELKKPAALAGGTVPQ